MAEQKTLEIGNSIIVLTEQTGNFSDGCISGYLTYYDERHRQPFPLTSEIITTFIATNLTDPRRSASWNTGFIVGWIEALCENHPDTFTSLVPNDMQEPEEQTPLLHMTILQEV
jgi:hypothetical protein